MTDQFVARGRAYAIGGFGLSDGMGRGGLLALQNNFAQGSGVKLAIDKFYVSQPIPYLASSSLAWSNAFQDGRYLVARLSSLSNGKQITDYVKMNDAAPDLPDEVKVFIEANATVGSILRRTGNDGRQGNSGASWPTGVSFFIDFLGESGLFFKFGSGESNVTSLRLQEGEAAGITVGVDSQSEYPNTQTFLVSVVLDIDDNSYRFHFLAEGLSDPNKAIVAIENGSGSGELVKIRYIRMDAIGFAEAANGAIFENNDYLHYFRSDDVRGGLDVEPDNISTGEESPENVSFKMGTYDKQIRFQRQHHIPKNMDDLSWLQYMQPVSGTIGYMQSWNGQLTDGNDAKSKLACLRREDCSNMNAFHSSNSGPFRTYGFNELSGIHTKQTPDNRWILNPGESFVVAMQNYPNNLQYDFELYYRVIYPTIPDNTYTRARLVNALA